MHRTIEIAVGAPGAGRRLAEQLARLDTVVGVTLHEGASLKPAGDVVVAQVLNRGADEVLKLADALQREGSVSVTTAEVASFIDPEHDDTVEDDVDEALWEEMETGLRHQGRVTPNFLTLMALGGAIAGIGLVSEPVPQATAFAASALITPAFEPIAKLALGGVLRRGGVVQRALFSTLAGYAVLIAVAGLTLWILKAVGATSVEDLVTNHEVERMRHPTALDLTTSGLAATAGMVIVAAYRRSVIGGPLMALILVPATALVGVGAAFGRWELVRAGLGRAGFDVLCILLFGALVVWFKQVTVHRRRPMV